MASPHEYDGKRCYAGREEAGRLGIDAHGFWWDEGCRVRHLRWQDVTRVEIRQIRPKGCDIRILYNAFDERKWERDGETHWMLTSGLQDIETVARRHIGARVLRGADVLDDLHRITPKMRTSSSRNAWWSSNLKVALAFLILVVIVFSLALVTSVIVSASSNG